MLSVIDKTKWADGPWKSEPDGGFVNINDLPCFAIRDMTTGCWGGYVGVPLKVEKLKILKVVISKEIRYKATGKQFKQDHFCNHELSNDIISKSNIDLEDYSWIGFKCEDAEDIAPGIEAIVRNIDGESEFKEKIKALELVVKALKIDRSYKDIEFVKEELIKLAIAVKIAMEEEYGNDTESGVH